ncbi:MAG: hypothetical protein PHC94_04225 [Methylobacter sp.]|nr:hypothetical protein [Methylobacter sp.]
MPSKFQGCHQRCKAPFPRGKKELGQDQQVHDQEDAVDPDEGGVRPLGKDVVEPVAPLALAEFSFDGDTAQVILSTLFLSLFQRRSVCIVMA